MFYLKATRFSLKAMAGAQIMKRKSENTPRRQKSGPAELFCLQQGSLCNKKKESEGGRFGFSAVASVTFCGETFFLVFFLI